MNKLKNLFLYGLLLLSVSTLFLSCGNDDDEVGGGNSFIVGVWFTESPNLLDENITDDVYYSYNEDGTFYYVSIRHFKNNSENVVIEVDKGKYKVKGSEISLWYEGDNLTTSGTFSIQGNKMTIITNYLSLKVIFQKVPYSTIAKYISDYENYK